MQLTDSYLINAPQERVWQALNDPDILARCIPGCEKLEKQSDTEFNAVVTTKVGTVKAKFNGSVSLEDLNPPHSYTMVGQGKGGPAGLAKVTANVDLKPQEGGTLLSYDAKATVSGKLAQIGARLIDSTAKRMAGEFFERFSKEVGEPAPATPEGAVAKPAAAPTSAATSGGGVSMWVWIAAAAALIALALAIL